MNGQKKKDKKTNNNNMSVIYKKNLHMKVKIEQHEPHKKLGMGGLISEMYALTLERVTV
jgi:hypothetical protein